MEILYSINGEVFDLYNNTKVYFDTRRRANKSITSGNKFCSLLKGFKFRVSSTAFQYYMDNNLYEVPYYKLVSSSVIPIDCDTSAVIITTGNIISPTIYILLISKGIARCYFDYTNNIVIRSFDTKWLFMRYQYYYNIIKQNYL